MRTESHSHLLGISENSLVKLLLGFYFLVGALYVWTPPIFEKPDEHHHFWYVVWLARGQGLPVVPVNAVTVDESEAPWMQEGSQPPLYYWLAAQVVRPPVGHLSFAMPPENPHAAIGVTTLPGNKNRFVHPSGNPFDTPLERAVYVARWFSLLLGGCVVVGVWRLGRLLLQDRKDVALVATAWLAFTPQFLFIASSVSNDVAVTTFSTLVLLLVVRSVLGPVQPRLALASAVLGGAVALSKLNGVALVPLAVGTLLVADRFLPSSHRRGVRPRVVAALFLLGAVVGAGWWYWRNWQLYGDPTGMSAMLAVVGRHEKPPSFSTLLWHLSGAWFSFWGVFGWFNLLAPSWWYDLLKGTVVVALLGAFGWTVKAALKGAWRTLPVPLMLAWAFVVTWSAIVFAGLVQWTRTTYGAQGRLLFPAIAPLFLVLAAGLAVWVPKAWYPRLFALLLGGWVVFAVWAPWGIIRPAYTPPPHGPQIALPADLVRVNYRYGPITLIGYTLEPERVAPGGIITITLYWQAQQRVTEPYSISVKIFGYRGQLLARGEGYPGQGTYPTTFWTPGEVVVDTWTLPLTSEADVPVWAEVWVDVYRRQDLRALEPLDSRGEKVDVPRVGRVLVASPPLPEESWPSARAAFDDGIALVTVAADPSELRSGADLTVTLTWLARAKPSRDYTVFVHLVPAGERIQPPAQGDAPPRQGQMPTGVWEPGDLVPDEHIIRLPARVPAGEYEVLVGLYDFSSGARLRVQLPDGTQDDAVRVLRLSFDGQIWRVGP